eukprot:gb/GECG01010875.1/.p1 GENE.gb/GECG01010875.1/~~gb/GECG01010875.1/.p1  ORF type:complete len:490 (+),score=54.83 gb/GECG01010875.1/:1-1470(+)
MEPNLVSFGILERDAASQDALMVWSYPYPGEAVEAVWLLDSGLQHQTTGGSGNAEALNSITGDGDVTEDMKKNGSRRYAYNRFRHLWHYICVVHKGLPNSEHKRIDSFAICLRAKEYFPRKYFALLDILSTKYFESGEPTYLLEAWISACMKGVAKVKLGENSLSWKLKHYSVGEALASPQRSLSRLHDIFGSHIVKIWHALCLRQRIIVYGANPETVVNAVCTLPLLIWHRANRSSGMSWDLCRPLISAQVADLSAEEVLSCAGALSSNSDNVCGDAADLDFASAQEIETEPFDEDQNFERAVAPSSGTVEYRAAIYQAADLLLCGTAGGFVAGTTSGKLQTRTEWYDVWIDLDSGRVNHINDTSVDSSSLAASVQDSFEVFSPENNTPNGQMVLTGVHAFVLEKMEKGIKGSHESPEEKDRALLKAFQQAGKKLHQILKDAVSQNSRVTPDSLLQNEDAFNKLGLVASSEAAAFLHSWGVAEGDLQL